MADDYDDGFILPLDGVDHKLLFKRYSGNVYYQTTPENTDNPWEVRIRNLLFGMFEAPPTGTSQAVLAGINAVAPSKKLYILPEELFGGKIDSAKTIPFDLNLTIRQSMSEGAPAGASVYGDCRTSIVRDDPGTWQLCQIDPKLSPGTGRGSSVLVPFTDHYLYKGPGSQADEVLLHEMVHALRYMIGTFNALPFRIDVLVNGSVDPNGPLKDHLIFGDIEEFFAILIANIYRAENRRTGLRAEETGFRSLMGGATDPKWYFDTFERQLYQLYAQKSMPNLFQALAKVQCSFNPIMFVYNKLLQQQNARNAAKPGR
jgi:hypothetical protein